MTSDEQRTEDNSGEEPRLVVRDRRRIDPETGQVRPAGGEEPTVGSSRPTAGPAEPPAGSEPSGASSPEAELKAELEERTADLQRVQAEYANYRKRIDRDREAVVATAKAQVATELLGVLDDIERAEQHGDLTGAFKAVADKLVGTLQRVGLESFGHDGEPFDPAVHEAVQHATSPDVAGPTVTAVLRRGYKLGDRLVRAALVAVTDHEPAAAEQPDPDESSDWFSPAQPGGAGSEQVNGDSAGDRANEQL